MSEELPRACRTFVRTVGAIGMVPLAWAVWSLVATPPPLTWYLLAGLTLLSGSLCIRIHSLDATISVSEGFIFTAALLFGPAAATAIAVIDGLAVSLWSTKRSRIRMLFGIAEPAISVCLASILFYAVAGVQPLLYATTPFAPLVGPLLALTAAYFGLNTLLVGTVVWLESGGRPLLLLRQHFPHLALNFSVSLSLAAALAQMNGNLTLAVPVMLLPMLLASYISSQQVAGRLEDTNRHLVELRRLYDSTVETLAMAIDAKDQVTHGHIRRVQLLSTRLARALGVPARDVQALEAAALLHDLGKLAVPEYILNKPGPLTPAEYDEMKKHAHVGASILSAIDFPFPVVPIVRHHHENWNGSGYPDGLGGAAIPIGARILAVVDCYDALTSDRPYRRRMTHDEALTIILSRSGTMYDPAVVEAFENIDTFTETEPGPMLSNVVSLPRRTAGRVQPSHAAGRTAASARLRTDCRDRINRFLATMEGASWDYAGQALATFFTTVQPDAVAALFRFDATHHRLVVVGTDRTSDPRIPETIHVGAGVTGWVAANKQAMVNADAELDLGDVANIVHPPLRQCVSVPILAGEDLRGVLTVYSPYAFSEIERMSALTIAEGLAGALQPASDESPLDAEASAGADVVAVPAGEIVSVQASPLAALARVLPGAALMVAMCACGPAGAADSAADAASVGHPPRGGELTAAIRDDPRTFNPYIGQSTSDLEVVTRLVHAPLVRIDRVTGAAQPWLAERWSASSDGLSWALTLRRGVRFSDGSPFSAADVLFALAAVYDPASASAIGDSLLVNGARIQASAPDDMTVVLKFPTRRAAGLQLLDNLPILPRRRLETALREGRLKEQWTGSTVPSDVIGLGPFRLAEYQPSERIVLERNPFYWRRDTRNEPLPYLNRITLAIVRDPNTELLRIQNGQLDVSAREIRPEDYVVLRRDQQRGRVALVDAGVGLDPNMLWFNLSTRASARDTRKPWLQSVDFRKAISHAIDRETLVDQVYRGAATPVFGPVSPGNRQWYAPDAPQQPYDAARANALLTGLGLADRNGDGVREDAAGGPVRFSIISQQQDTIRMRTLAVIQEHLRRVGIAVDVVGLDAGSIIERWSTGRYDAIYFGIEATSYDPADNIDFWRSSGSFHVWNAGQEVPMTDWERRIDELMERLMVSPDPSDRQRLFAQVQQTFGEHIPVICFAVPRVIVAMSPRVMNASPAPLRPPILWSADTLAVSTR